MYSAGDVNLYAGANKDYTSSTFNGDLEANSYVEAVVPVPLISLKNTVTENNQVTVEADSAINAIRNINLFGSSGNDKIEQRTVQYTWYTGDNEERKYVGSATGSPDYGAVIDNYVKIDGTLDAGMPKTISVQPTDICSCK